MNGGKASAARRARSRRPIRLFAAAAVLSVGLSLAAWQWRPGLLRLRTVAATRVPARSAVAASIIAGLHAQEGTAYDPEYALLSYPMGDVPSDRGACTDVVIRALRHAGYDLQRLMHEDMARNFARYPQKWGLDRPDPNIDHRRAPNQVVFFKRHGLMLTNEVSRRTLPQWQPGDIVFWDRGRNRYHAGVVSDGVNRHGIPLVVHNNSICIEDDCLTRWRIRGHYRFPASRPMQALPAARSRMSAAAPAA